MSTEGLSPLRPVVLADAGAWTMRSSRGYDYEISIAWPSTPSPDDGFPVLYVLDAGSIFATIVETSRRHARRSEATGVAPLVIVGINHAGAGPVPAQRTRDYTPALDDSSRASDSGGANDFRDWIEQDLKPAVESRLTIDRSRQSILGHSLAGFWVLQALLGRQTTFSSFVSVSPSIWWAPDWIDTHVARYVSTVALESRVRLLVTVGEYEETLAPWQPASAAESAGRRRAQRLMVTRARHVSEALQSAADVQYILLPGCDHASALTTSLPAAFRFVSG